jgi:hypothetical protein
MANILLNVQKPAVMRTNLPYNDIYFLICKSKRMMDNFTGFFRFKYLNEI